MNERIKELAVKAGIYGAVDINGNFENEAGVEKFAELIVRECANIADLNDCGSSDEWDKCARGISRDIKLTFGVEP